MKVTFESEAEKKQMLNEASESSNAGNAQKYLAALTAGEIVGNTADDTPPEGSGSPEVEKQKRTRKK